MKNKIKYPGNVTIVWCEPELIALASQTIHWSLNIRAHGVSTQDHASFSRHSGSSFSERSELGSNKDCRGWSLCLHHYRYCKFLRQWDGGPLARHRGVFTLRLLNAVRTIQRQRLPLPQLSVWCCRGQSCCCGHLLSLSLCVSLYHLIKWEKYLM